MTTQLNKFAFAGLFSVSLALGCAPVDTDAEGTDSRQDGVRVCAESTTVKGVDVSFYQGNVTWSKVKSAGYEFAFARVSDGTQYVDDQFTTNWAGIKQAGLVRGAYQFFRPGQSAETQADIMINALGTLGDGDLPAVIDVETADGQSSATIVSKIKTWISKVEKATGKTPIIYAAMGFWDSLSGTAEFAGYPLWVANYGVSCPYLPNTWGDWHFWQYTDAGSVPGIAGGVDTNYFNGTREELLAFASKPVSTVALGVAWTRNADGSYTFTSAAPQGITKVEYYVDGYAIGSSTKAQSATFSTGYKFSTEKVQRFFEAKGFDASNKQIARGIGLLDVVPGVSVFIRQTGTKEYEIGLERAPAEVASLEVRADGYLLTDGVSGKSKSTRLAVKSGFTTLGQRSFSITTYNADGSKRGTLTRTFSLE